MAADPKKPYGDVTYADPGYQEDGIHRYPIDTEKHVRNAWSRINDPSNAKQYSAENLARVKARIVSAGKKYGITFAEQRSAGRTLHLRSVDMQLRAIGDGRTVEGRVVPYGEVIEFDEDGLPGKERFVRGALSRMTSAWDRVHLYLTHLDTPFLELGYGRTLEERADGAWATFRLHPSVADRARELLTSTHRGLSLAFHSLTHHRDSDGVVNRLRVHVQHVAAVPDPAYAGAFVRSVREALGVDGAPDTEEAVILAENGAQGSARPRLTEALADLAMLRRPAEERAMIDRLRGERS